MTEFKKIKFFKTLQEVFFAFLHIADDLLWVIFTASTPTAFLVTLCHEVMKCMTTLCD